MDGKKVEKKTKFDKNFQESVDSWIKQIKSEYSDVYNEIENIYDLIDDNYESLFLKIEDLKQEIEALKLIQILTIKQNQKKVELK